MKKNLSRLAALALTAVIAAGAAPSVSAAEYGWQETGGTKKYFMENDEYAKGIYVIDGVAHKFDSEGNYIGIYTGLSRHGNILHFYDNGLLYRDGWLRYGGNTYYFYPDGSAAKGITEIDGITYYFTSGGSLKKDTASFEVAADKSLILTGKRDTIRFTVTTDNLSSEAILGNIGAGCLHQYKNGKWYRVSPDTGFSFSETVYTIGKSSKYGTVTEKVTLSFTPEAYKLDLETGLYRVKIPIYTNGKTITKYCEFNIVEPAQVSTPRSEYYLADVNEISFSINVNNTSRIYSSEAAELFRLNETNGEWEKLAPKKASSSAPSSYEATAGSTITAKLDLDRYSRTELRTGKYRAVLGSGLSCDFKLIAPFDCTASEDDIESTRRKQITLTVVNDTDRPVELEGYGTLYRLNKNKWKKIELKKGKKLDTRLSVPAMTKWNKTFVLTDYYELRDLKKGSYCIQLRDKNGFVNFAYFDLG